MRSLGPRCHPERFRCRESCGRLEARGRLAGADPQRAWAQVARVLLEEMLPGSVAGVHGGAAVALAPGDSATQDRIWDVVRELAAVYGPAAPRDVAPASFLAAGCGYSGAPGDMAPGHSAGEAPHGHVAPGRFPGEIPGGYASAAAPGGTAAMWQARPRWFRRRTRCAWRSG